MYLEIQDNFFYALETQSSEIWLACRSSEKVEKWDPMVLILHLWFPFQLLLASLALGSKLNYRELYFLVITSEMKWFQQLVQPDVILY